MASSLLSSIRDLLAADKLDDALKSLRILLDHSPLLDEAILQTARWNDIRAQIRKGVVGQEDANVTKNQIRDGLLGLLREIEEQEQNPAIWEEIAKTNATYQIAEKIYNITHIDKADFS
ncbi:MAG: hypothetical protein IPL49_04770 [Saprospirales bacterium]|nr:hypothetical protein [Saprospirales bacterium]